MAGLREALESAFDQHADNEEADERSQSEDSRDAETVDKLIGQPESEQPDGSVADAEGREVLEVRPRAKDGKFVKAGAEKQPDADKVPADGQQPEKTKSEEVKQQTTSAVKGPVSWRPDRREKFSKLDPDIQEEINRREKEIETGLRESAGARQYAQALHNEISPYSAMIQAEGGNPVTAVRALMQTAYQLRMAPPLQKAQLVAAMIQKHGVDISMLDQALAGMQTGTPTVDPQMQFIQQELAPIKQFMQGLQQRQAQMTTADAQSAQAEFEAFAADPKNEFFADVAPLMADFMDVATKQGQKMTLSDAYARAIVSHPTISKVLEGRRISAGAAQRTAAARRAQNASASLPSGGAPAGAAVSQQKPGNLRSAVEAAWDQVETASGS